MLIEVRRVWVVQCKSTGQFLNLDLCLVRSLKHAGRAPDLECARETGRLNLGHDYETHSFLEIEEC
jgi:hypothetical protein